VEVWGELKRGREKERKKAGRSSLADQSLESLPRGTKGGGRREGDVNSPVS